MYNGTNPSESLKQIVNGRPSIWLVCDNGENFVLFSKQRLSNIFPNIPTILIVLATYLEPLTILSSLSILKKILNVIKLVCGAIVSTLHRIGFQYLCPHIFHTITRVLKRTKMILTLQPHRVTS